MYFHLDILAKLDALDFLLLPWFGLGFRFSEAESSGLPLFFLLLFRWHVIRSYLADIQFLLLFVNDKCVCVLNPRLVLTCPRLFCASFTREVWTFFSCLLVAFLRPGFSFLFGFCWPGNGIVASLGF